MKIYFKFRKYEKHDFNKDRLGICLDLFDTWISFKYRKTLAENVEMEYASEKDGNIKFGKRNRYKFTFCTIARINWKKIRKGSYFFRVWNHNSDGPVK